MNKTKPIPPHLATKLLHTFLRDDLLEEVSGDLEEKFYKTLSDQSLLRAKMNYWYEVLNYVRPFALRKSKSIHINQYAMFENYFKITTRSLLNQKLYSVINIGGLSLGLTCFLIILLYVQHEFSYNRFYENADHIYRVYQKQAGNVSMGTDYFAVTPAPLATVMREEIPQVKYATSIEQSSGLLSRKENNYWEKGLAGDDQFFKVLPMQFIQGSAETALKDPQSIILTLSLAEKIFGFEDPIGQSVRYQNEVEYTVTAIVNDPPFNSSLEYGFIINILSDEYYAEEVKKAGWSNNAYHTFFVLQDGADPKEVETKFPGLLKKYLSSEEDGGYPTKDQYFVQSISELYFQTNVNSDIGLKGSRDTVKLFSLVALIVLVLACVNYMNLAVARSIKRSREVGLRKVVGAVRTQLIIQFLGESVLITFLSLMLAFGLTYMLLPFFGQLMERQITIDFLFNPLLLPLLFALVVIVGVFSGSYPALVMSSLRPIEVLKAKVSVKLAGFSLQRILIIVQFAASITLVISSLVIYRQLHFMRAKELGYDKQDIITMRVRDRSLQDKFEQLADEWKQHSGVSGVTLTSHLPSNITSSTTVNSRPGNKEKTSFPIYRLGTEYSSLDVFGIPLLGGRNFSKEHNDAKSCLINETASKALGWTPEEAIGKEVYLNQDETKTVIGVVRDFHMHSMHLPIQPLMLQLSDRGYYLSLKINHEAVATTLAAIEKTFRKNSPYPFEYQWMEDNFNQLYQSEMKLGEIFGFFTLISVLIASLGLFGLAAFLSAQRTKEIGVRKVLGASVQSIVLLLSKDFLKLIVIAFAISIPLGWYAMDRWLQDFAYHIDIGWWIFAVAGMLAFVVANLSVGYQSLKASRMDPVDSLRSE